MSLPQHAHFFNLSGAQNIKILKSHKSLSMQFTFTRIFYFSEKVAQLRELKLNDIIIDPGFGFAKDTAQNFELMNHLSELNALELPMLVGISRKSMIYKTLDLQPQEALNGTTFLNTVSLLAGTKILRVHDVKEAVECVKLYEQLKN